MRLFFALWPPEAPAEALALLARLQALRLGGRATRRETVHLTLLFLGEQAVERLPDIISAASRVRMRPFELSLDRLGAWRHNRLLWAGCSASPQELSSLAEQLRVELCNSAIPFDDDKRPFVPHLTLVRKLAERSFPLDLPPLAPVAWHADRFVLVESQLSQAGPGYRIVAEFPVSDPSPPHRA